MGACAGCGLQNPPEATFCRGCGQALATTSPCPACSHPNPIDSRFCNSCGAPIGPGAASALEEDEGSLGVPAPPEWAELSRLVEELTDEARQPGDGQLPAAGAPVTPAPSNGTAPFVEVSLAECLAGNGGGPVLRLPARHVLRVDQEKATSQMNSALPVPTATGKIARKRPSWREPQD